MAVVLLALTAAPAAAATCPDEARCASIRVPLDHSGAVPGTLPLSYAVLPATGTPTGTIAILTGGPGQSAVPYAGLLREVTNPLRRTHDVLLVDQRGTGASGAVACDFEGDNPVRACVRKLGRKRAFLTSAESARDLEDLRAALGVERLTLFGVSYGTKVAGEYARRFPGRTAAVVLDSPVGVDGMDFIDVGGIQALPRVLRETCAAGPCAGTVRDPAAALYAAVDRMRRKPPGEFGAREVRKTAEDALLFVVAQADVDPGLRADLPAALASLARGDIVPLGHTQSRLLDAVLADDPELDDEIEPEDLFTESRFFATACLESFLPWSPASRPATRKAARRAYFAALGARPFAPFRPSVVWRNSALTACEEWPATAVPEPVPAAGPDVPVLVLSGRADLRTPLELAQRVAAAYPRATLLDVPHVGHSVLTSDPHGCALNGLITFLAGGVPAPCTGGPQLPGRPYLPVELGAKTRAEAVAITIEGARHDVKATELLLDGRRRFQVQGLRGGVVQARRGRLRLREVEWFRGVAVSGTLSAQGNGRLRVEGPAGLRGTTRVQGFQPI
jgi:pimeloyl-ACP methyl ester carboxylesterase